MCREGLSGCSRRTWAVELKENSKQKSKNYTLCPVGCRTIKRGFEPAQIELSRGLKNAKSVCGYEMMADKQVKG